jgi:two-component system, NtrC family, sensor kinase
MLEKISISTDAPNEELTVLRQRVEQLEKALSEKALSDANRSVQEQYYNLRKDYQKIEQALRESQHKLSFLVQYNPLGVICWNTAFEVTDWNLAAENIFGYSKLEALNCHSSELIVPESAKEQVKQLMIALLQQNGGVCSTNDNLTKDGRVITCKWYNKPLTDLSGNVIGIISIVEDVTLRQETELALQRSQARFQKLAANVPGMIYQFRLSPDGTTSFPYVSDACEEIYGVKPEEVKENGALLVEVVHPEDKSSFFESVAVSAQTLQKWDWEGRMFCRSGKLKWIRGISRPELQPDGAILWDGLLIDISERQQAKLALEQANEELEQRVEERTIQLKQSQQLLQLVFDTLPQRVFWKDRNSNYLGCNKLFAQDIGLSSPEEIVGKNDFELFGKELARIYQIDDITNIESNCPKINYEETQQRENGTLGWLRKSKIPLRNQDGEIIGVFGCYEDISDRKQAEAALRESEERLRTVIGTAPLILFALDSQGNFTFSDGEGLRALGLNSKDIIGKSAWEIFGEHPDILQLIEEALAGKIATGLFNFLGIFFESRFTPVRDDLGKIIGTIGVAIDITDRKVAEAGLAESEAKFRSFVENSSYLMYSYSKDGIFSYLSPNFTDILGYEAQEFIGKSFVTLVHSEDLSTVKDYLNRIIETGEKQTGLELRVKRKDGSWCWMRASTSPVKDAGGNLIAFQGMANDITERKQAKLALQKSLKEVEDIKFALDQSAIVAVTNNRGIIEYINDQFCQISQYNREELIGKTHHIINSGHHPREFFQEMWRTIAEGKVWKGEIQNRAKDGTFYWVDTTVVPVLDAQGKPQQYVAIRNDITSRKQAEAALKKQAKELEETLKKLQHTQSQLIQSEKMSSLGQLVAGIAHEINNPVNFIYGNLKYAEKFTQDLLKLLNLYQTYYPDSVSEIEEEIEACELEFLLEDLPKIYSSMKVGATRIREIVAGLRTFSRLDEAELKTADIHQGIDSTLMILEHRLKAKPNCVAIKVIKKYANLPLVECYAGQLNQVFMNILTNAIDALEEQRISPTQNPEIRIVTEIPTPNQITIRIADNGCGISEEVQKKLFDPFYTTKAVGKGTGMGLSISYQIITDRHGGSLRCISSRGQGAEFIIEIPYC